jgi:hypothetical protein
VKIFCSRRQLTLAATALLLSAGALSVVRPADAAKHFNPDSPKGTFIGTFTSTNGQHSGAITLKITSDKRNRFVPNANTLAGTIQFAGSKSQKIIGTYLVPIRRVALALKDNRHNTLHTNVQSDLSADGTTITGVYLTNVAGEEDGTVTLTRH